MRNYGQVIHKIIQRGNRNMATVSKDVTLYGFWASSGIFYSLAPHVATIQRLNPTRIERIVGKLKKRHGESGQPWFIKISIMMKFQ